MDQTTPNLEPADAAADRPPRRAWDLAFFAAAIVMAWLMCPPYFTDWDSFDYAVYAMNGQPTSLALGRIYFTGLHALAWQVGHGWFGLQPADTFPLFCGVTIFLGGLTAVAVFRAAFHLTGSTYAAVLAGLIWITSPQPLVYAGSIMTETPTMFLFATSIVLTERSVRARRVPAAMGLAALAGAAFAVACNMREPLICFGLYYAGRCLLAGPNWTHPVAALHHVPLASQGRLLAGPNWTHRLSRASAFLNGFIALFALGLALAAWRLGGIQPLLDQFTGWLKSMAEERREVPNDVWRNTWMLTLFAGSVSIVGLFWVAPALAYALRRAIHKPVTPLPLGEGKPRSGAGEGASDGPNGRQATRRGDWGAPSPGLGFAEATLSQRERVTGRVRWTPLAWLLLGAGAYLFTLLINHDTPVNPRFAMPLMFGLLILEAAVLADVIGRGDRRWFIALVGLGLLGNLVVSLGVTWEWAGWLLYMSVRGKMPFETWALFVLMTALVLILARQALRATSPLQKRLTAAAIPALLGIFVLTGGYPLLDFHFYSWSHYKKRFVAEMTQPGVVPPDAMLIPSGETPELQYLVAKIDSAPSQHKGWAMPGVPYQGGYEELLRQVGQPTGKGWFIVSSGWNWPNGKDKEGNVTAARKARLTELVDRYLAGDGRVFIYGGDSSWVPGTGRKNEWPQIRELQETHTIADKPIACDMYEVFKDRPQPGSRFYPLGHRQAIKDGRMKPTEEDEKWFVPTTQP